VEASAPARKSELPKPDPGLRYVARQPVLTADEQVFGYELLFRDGIENYFRCCDVDAASRSTLDSSLLLGLDVLCGKHYAFVNCTQDVLVSDYAFLLPPGQTVIEVLEGVQPDDTVLSACRRLKQAGYLIALDDFVANGPREPLIEIADIIKVDLRSTAPEQQDAIVRRYGAAGVCWPKRSRPARNSTPLANGVFSIFRVISSADRKC
jgi:EAL and modified HD-GYP domain-containing signal transduction protein